MTFSRQLCERISDGLIIYSGNFETKTRLLYEVCPTRNLINIVYFCSGAKCRRIFGAVSVVGSFVVLILICVVGVIVFRAAARYDPLYTR